jgi:hypothetical protein
LWCSAQSRREHGGATALESEDLHEENQSGVPYLSPATAFPEVSPSHPSYGSGHATVAGAYVTTLKAFFDENQCLSKSRTRINSLTFRPAV